MTIEKCELCLNNQVTPNKAEENRVFVVIKMCWFVSASRGEYRGKWAGG